jgi:hypothetical protein
VQALESGGEGGVDQILEHRASRNAHDTPHDVPVDFDTIRCIAQDHAGKSTVVRDQIGPAADQSMRIITHRVQGGD